MNDKHQVGGTHYTSMKIQPIDFITSNELDYATGNVIKYVCRHRRKGGVDDIDKAIDYLFKIAQKEYGKYPEDLSTVKNLLNEVVGKEYM